MLLFASCFWLSLERLRGMFLASRLGCFYEDNNMLLIVKVSRQKGTKSYLTVPGCFNAGHNHVVWLADTPWATLLLGSLWGKCDGKMRITVYVVNVKMQKLIQGKGMMCFGTVSESCTCSVGSRRLKSPWVAEWSKAVLPLELLSQRVCGEGWTSSSKNSRKDSLEQTSLPGGSVCLTLPDLAFLTTFWLYCLLFSPCS